MSDHYIGLALIALASLMFAPSLCDRVRAEREVQR